jgi:Tfp pilus assembly protein PilF
MLTVPQLLALAVAHHQAGKLPEAERLYQQVLQAEPNQADAWHLLGLIAHQRGQTERAVASIQQALRLNPSFAEAHYNLGNVLRQGDRLEEAALSYQQAVRLKPGYAEAHNNLGAVLYQRGQWEEAVAGCRQAIHVKPDYADAYNNLSVVLAKQGKVEESLAAAEEAIRLRPDFAGAHKNHGMQLLLSGQFAEGWPEYEWRRQCNEFPTPSLNAPLWDGSPLEGRTIVLWSEQGLGDAIQFIRYAPPVKERGGNVVVLCQPPLTHLLASCPGVDRVVPQGSPIAGPVHVQAPLLSLPGIFGTTLETIPANVPYLRSDPARIEAWRQRLACYADFKIGLIWQGSPRHLDDRWRSLPLTQFALLARVPGVQLFSLQNGPGSEQLRAISWPVVDLGSQFDGESLEDAAAATLNLDLVVTVDTALAHLAGALAVPAWVALPFAPDWRWLRHRSDSPWYPSVRLFRQRERGDWNGVVDEMVAALPSVMSDGQINSRE